MAKDPTTALRRPFLIAGALGLALAGCAGDDAPGPRLGRPAADEDEIVSDDDGADVLVGQESGGLAPAPVAPASCDEPGLALCLRFEGSTADESSVKLAAAEATGIAFVAGRDGQAGVFAPDSALRFAPSAALDLPSGAATIEAWINRSAAGADAVVFDDDARFSLTIDAAGHLWCKSSRGAVTGTRPVSVAQWVYVACVVDGAELRAYVDGALDAAGPGGIDPSPLSGAAVGGNAPSGEPFVGMIDSLRLFAAARTAAQIAAAASRQ